MSLVTLKRSAWGLDTGDDSPSWRRRAVCTADRGDLHAVDNLKGRVSGVSKQAQARHICVHHCPVLRECFAEAMEHRPTYVVQGGLVWGALRGGRGEPNRCQPDAGHGEWCGHLKEVGRG